MDEPQKFVVAKAFNSVNRRFAVGDRIEAVDVVDRDFEELKRQHFVVAESAAGPATKRRRS